MIIANKYTYRTFESCPICHHHYRNRIKPEVCPGCGNFWAKPTTNWWLVLLLVLLVIVGLAFDALVIRSYQGLPLDYAWPGRMW